ncbi:MAG: filamentous hemagglutinin N-terminal domain-containing protein, partial [Waterburya sp.]
GDSQISAQASNNANGGNITIDTDFLVAFPAQVNGNDIIANASQGSGGNITINPAAEIFGIQEREAQAENRTNDFDVSSDFGFDGDLSIDTDVNPIEGIRDLAVQAIAPEETVQQVCSANNIKGSSSLSFKGKGGIPIEPISPMSSDNILMPEQFAQTNQPAISQNSYPELATEAEQYPPVITAQGAIYPARGLIVTDKGKIILTRSSQQQTSRLPEQGSDCLRNLTN